MADATHQPADGSSKIMGVLAHLLTFLFYFIAPLAFLVASQDPWVKEHAKASLNFQLTLLIAVFLLIPLSFVGIGLLLAPIVGIVATVFILIATIKAVQEQTYRYPLAIPFLK